MAVSDDCGLLLGYEAHFVDSALSTDFVDDADESIGDGDQYEKEVFVATDGDDHRSEDDIDEIEDSEGVA